MRWIVAQTKTKRESYAAENVAKQGFEYYLPQFIDTVVLKGEKVARAQPLFPSYLFVRTEGQWHFLLGTFGMVGVVLAGTEPAIMPDAAIDALKKRENDEGMIVLPTIDKSLKQDQSVRIRKGPLVDKIGIYDGVAPNDRVRVLLDYLGKRTPVLIDAEDIEGL